MVERPTIPAEPRERVDPPTAPPVSAMSDAKRDDPATSVYVPFPKVPPTERRLPGPVILIAAKEEILVSAIMFRMPYPVRKRDPRESVPLPETVLANTAGLSATPDNTTLPSPSVDADRLPPAEIETVPPLVFEITLEITDSMERSPPPFTVTVPFPSAVLLAATNAPPLTTVLPL